MTKSREYLNPVITKQTCGVSHKIFRKMLSRNMHAPGSAGRRANCRGVGLVVCLPLSSVKWFVSMNGSVLLCISSELM